MEIKEKLVTLRKKKGLSQLQLAEMMDVSRQAISKWEVGAAVPSTENLKYLGRLYNVPLEYLLHDDAPEPACVDQESEEQKAESVVKKKIKSIVLVLIVIGVIVRILFCVGNGTKRPVSIGNIEGRETEAGKEVEFEVEW